MIPVQRCAHQRGSALLIVFVFAAMIAIMLYRELPVATFEAQRQKEQLLIDRGNEYKRAIKLYVRKFQTFPPSMEALENTNRMRFLRNRYVDPFTGKDDWRLLHAGPGGIIIDSKLKQNQLNPNGMPGSPGGSVAGSQTGFSTASNSGFGASSSGFGSGSTDTSPVVTEPRSPASFAFPQRPPAVAINGAGAASYGGAMPGAQGQTQDGQQTDSQENAQGPPNGPIYPQIGNAPDSGQSLPPSVPSPGRFSPGQTGGDPSAAPQDPQSGMQSMLNNPNPQPTMQNGAVNGGTAPGAGMSPINTVLTPQGNLMGGGGIAGVASKSAGPAIKTVNEQTDRSLWEFVYDMRQEAMANVPGMGIANTNSIGANGGMNGTQNGQGNNSGFGSSNQNSSFGSGFGNPQSSPAPNPTTNQ